jgi:hypothetical protein
MSLRVLFAAAALCLAGCVNPFAPGLDDSSAIDAGQLDDMNTIDGVLQTMRKAYAYRDTTIYGKTLAPDFIFIYRDYDKGVDVFWGRDVEIQSTYGLFQNAQRLDLIWNNAVSVSGDTAQSVRATVIKNFNLTVTFSPTDVLRISGYANLTLERSGPDAIWQIVQWRDESNY